MLLFWRIWHHRNDIVFGKGDSIISVSVAFLENYLVSLNTSAANDSSISAKGKSPCTSEKPHAPLGNIPACEKEFPWLPPPPGWIKLNVDASYDPIKRQAGTGWSRDSLCGSAEEAECIAALSGIRKALQFSSGPILLESDCLNVVQAITEISLNRSANCYIIEELREH